MKQEKLYNIIFPFWILWMIPIAWLIIIPSNFIVDSLLLILFMRILKIDNIVGKYRKSIMKVWLLGFLADIIGCIPLMFMGFSEFGEDTYLLENLRKGIMLKPLSNIYSIIFTAVCVIISGILIYIFNYKIALKKVEFNDSQKKKIALLMAIFTAPYLFFMPAIQ